MQPLMGFTQVGLDVYYDGEHQEIGPVDPRFGRAPNILIVDSDTLEFQALDNSVNVNAFRTLEAAGLKVVNDVSGTVMEAIAAFKVGKFACSTAANAEGHW